jgi:hypothetical protein
LARKRFKKKKTKRREKTFTQVLSAPTYPRGTGTKTSSCRANDRSNDDGLQGKSGLEHKANRTDLLSELEVAEALT